MANTKRAINHVTRLAALAAKMADGLAELGNLLAEDAAEAENIKAAAKAEKTAARNSKKEIKVEEVTAKKPGKKLAAKEAVEVQAPEFRFTKRHLSCTAQEILAQARAKFPEMNQEQASQLLRNFRTFQRGHGVTPTKAEAPQAAAKVTTRKGKAASAISALQ